MTFPHSFQAPPQAKSQLFTVSGQFMPDPSATWVYVEGVGGGASGQSNLNAAANGGPGGLWDWALIPANLITSPVLVTVGAGGVTPGGTSAAIVPGGDSKFGTFLTCKGGGNGYSSDGTGGVGSAGSTAGSGGNSLRGGGGGGGGGYPSGASGGASLRGGAGGAGAGSGTAGSGVAPGGGGGGNYSGNPGNGARGQMLVYWW